MKFKISAYHIPVFLYRYGFLLLALPMQTFVFADTTAIYLANTLFASGIILCACIHHKSISAYYKAPHLVIKKGAVLHHHNLFYTNKIRSLCITQGPLQRYSGIYKITAVSGKNQARIYLHHSQNPLDGYLFANEGDAPCALFTDNLFATLLLSAGFYNAFTTALALIPFLRKLSILSSYRVVATIPYFTTLSLNTNLSLIFSYISLAIIFLWVFGTVVTFCRYFNLSLKIWGNTIKICRGLFVKRCAYILRQNISAVVLQQNLLMILLNRYTGEFRISCEKRENKITFMCGSSITKFRQILNTACLYPKGKVKRLYPKSLLGYTYLPMFFLLVFSFALICSDVYFPSLKKIRFGLFITLWLVGWFIFRLCVYNRCFIGADHNTLVVGCYRGLTFCLAYIPEDKIRLIKITRTPFQRIKNSCSVRVYIKGRRKHSFCVKHTEYKKTAELISKLCGMY